MEERWRSDGGAVEQESRLELGVVVVGWRERWGWWRERWGWKWWGLGGGSRVEV